MNEKQFLELLKKHAESNNIRLNPNTQLVKTLVKGMLENEKKYGSRYCTCRVIAGNKEKDIKNICPCVFHLDEIKSQGRCLCRLFLKR